MTERDSKISRADQRLLDHASRDEEYAKKLGKARPDLAALLNSGAAAIEAPLSAAVVTPIKDEDEVPDDELVDTDGVDLALDQDQDDEEIVGEGGSDGSALSGVNIVSDRLSAEKRAKSPLGFVDRAITGMWQTGVILTDPEVHSSLLEVARETVETIRTEASARNSGIRTDALLTVTANAKNVLTNLGVEMDSFAEFLQLGLDRLKEEDDTIPDDLQVTEPLGFAIALTRVYAPLVLAPIQATSELAAERADIMIMVGDEENKHKLESKKAELSSLLAIVVSNGERQVGLVKAANEAEVGEARIAGEVRVAEKRSHNQAALTKGEEASQAILAAKTVRYGRVASAFLKGLGYVPLAPVAGVIDSVIEFVEDKPVFSIGSALAIADLLWWGAPAVEGFGVVALGVFGQVLWDKVSGKYRKQTGEVIENMGESIKGAVENIADKFSRKN